MLRRTLDRIYLGSGVIASLLIAAICLLVCTQVIFNLITRFGGISTNLTIPSYGDFAGYMLAASSFLALAYTLTRGGHIRVNLVLTRLPAAAKLAAETLSLFLSLVLSLFATYYMAKHCLEAFEFGDLSPGMVAIPIWIPQSTVLLGMIILTVALIDCLFCTIVSRTSVFDAVETERQNIK